MFLVVLIGFGGDFPKFFFSKHKKCPNFWVLKDFLFKSIEYLL